MEFAYPLGSIFLLLIGTIVFWKKQRVSKMLIYFCLAYLWVGGNFWVSRGLLGSLEAQHMTLDDSKMAEIILVLGGGVYPMIDPRPSLEVGDAGDRILYAAKLFHEGKAPLILCSSGIAPSSNDRINPASINMLLLLKRLGVPEEAIITETRSRTTYENIIYSNDIFKNNNIKNVILVTSASHMPRSIGVFKKLNPNLTVIPAPTDLRVVERNEFRVFDILTSLIPTAQNHNTTRNALHEYIGIVYYKYTGKM